MPLNEMTDGVRSRTVILPVFLRSAGALFVWLLVSSISLCVAWRSVHNGRPATREQFFTKLNMDESAKLIANQRQLLTNSPITREDLFEVSGNSPLFGEGRFRDQWGHPLVISSTKTNLILVSYGRDGKPGGLGLDCDLRTDEPFPKDAQPTLHQFLFEAPFHGMVITCIFCGALAAVLCFLTADIPDIVDGGVIFAHLLAMILIVIAAVFVGWIMAMIHLPIGTH